MGSMRSKISQTQTMPRSNTSLPSSIIDAYLPKSSKKVQAPVVDLIQSSCEQIEVQHPPVNEVKNVNTEPNTPKNVVEQIQGSLNTHETLVPPVANQPNLPKAKEKIRLKGPFTLSNFEKHLRQIWEKDPTLTERQFFELAKKLFAMIEEDKKILINFNKKWCYRFHKMMLKEHDPSQMECEIIENGDNQVMISESQDFFSEPESAQADTTVENTSNLWKRHTLKLLSQKHPSKAIGRKSKFEIQEEKNAEVLHQDIWMVNSSMVKTLENRKAELMRLEAEFNSHIHRRRVSLQANGGSSSSKKKKSRSEKEIPCNI